MKYTFISVLSLIGLTDAIYLSYNHFSKSASVVCNLFSDCDNVLNSQYATIGIIPLALIGVGYYLLIGFLAQYQIYHPSHLIKRFLLFVTTLGLLATTYFVYLQALVIQSWCQYCLLSALITVILWLIIAYDSIYLSRSVEIIK